VIVCCPKEDVNDGVDSDAYCFKEQGKNIVRAWLHNASGDIKISD
jgi:hypothetical protein